MTVPPTPQEAEIAGVAVVLAAHFGLRPWSEMAEDRADLRVKFRDQDQPKTAFDINEHTRSDCRYAAAEVLETLAARATAQSKEA